MGLWTLCTSFTLTVEYFLPHKPILGLEAAEPEFVLGGGLCFDFIESVLRALRNDFDESFPGMPVVAAGLLRELTCALVCGVRTSLSSGIELSNLACLETLERDRACDCASGFAWSIDTRGSMA